MPFTRRGQGRVGTLALGNMGFPLGLTGQGSEAGHVTFPVEIIHGITYHKDVIFKTIDLHIKDTDGTLAFNHFGPYVGMEFAIFLNEFWVVDEY